MKNVSVDFSASVGAVKPMHSVNNGPAYKFASDQRITNLEHFQAAGIPYARTHDASFYATYGGEHIVDVNMIFTDFSKDPEDPASYDFRLTDDYLRVIELGGSRVFYRLGSKIEHWPKKYNTLPPPDFKKWAVICEHIIRHYTEGWADGFHMDIEYWEIWNEPDLDADDSTHKRTWGGTKAMFFDLYEITAKHLKACFPHLKIGGPAVAGVGSWAEDFLAEMKKREVPIDFFSWHIYSASVEKVRDRIRFARQIMDENGYEKAESILNEWNYVRGWHDEDWIYSLKMEKGLKGSAFVASVMEMAQGEPLDNLMYYDARPCAMNGMFSTDYVCDRLKGYYPFWMFNRLYQLGTSVPVITDGNIWATAAKGENGAMAVMLTHYCDDDATPAEQVSLALENLGARRVRVRYYLLDGSHDGEAVWEEAVQTDAISVSLKMPLFSTWLVEITPE